MSASGVVGTVRWFNIKKGYGFVTPDDPSHPDVFVHHTQLKADGFALLREGQKVKFDIGNDASGKPAASNVTAADGSLLDPNVKVSRPKKKRAQTGTKTADSSTSAEATKDLQEKPSGRKRRPRQRQRVPRFTESEGIKHLKAQAIKGLQESFGAVATTAAFASGRVNLIGEHVDYNDGIVFPFSIHFGTCAVARVREGGDGPAVRVHSVNMKNASTASFEIDQATTEPKWANYVKGVVYHFDKEVAKVPKIDIAIASNVPLGSGLSSSASLEVAIATLLEAVTETKCASAMAKAQLCVDAEHNFAKVPCGIMDQSIAVMGRNGHGLLLDCRSKKVKHVPVAGGGEFAFVVVNSNVSHSLADGEYAKRKQQCTEGLELLKKGSPGLTSLRDATLEMVDAAEKANPSSLPLKRVRHVVGEIKRVEDCVSALQKDDHSTVGRLMNESHDSLQSLYEVSCKELDTLVSIARGLEGVYGSRMTGGGFGGCTITLVSRDRADAVKDEIVAQYKAKTGIEPMAFATVPSTGTRTLSVSAEK